MITEVTDDGMLIKKFKKSTVDRAFGIWNTKTSSVNFVEKLRKDWRR